jgi:NAD(P)-dependent dehydrogenase (short-subunit alcohol dehydrogenase family)
VTAAQQSTPQRPIDSGFGATSTAADVLAGLDLSGRLAVVTGGYSGLGLEATRALTAAGAHVVVPARRPEVAAENLAGIDGVETDALDLGDLDSVAAFARRFLDSGRRIAMIRPGAATSPQLAGMGGVYLEDCEIANVVDGSGALDGRGGRRDGVQPYAIDPDQAARLWAYSVELSGVDGFSRG